MPPFPFNYYYCFLLFYGHAIHLAIIQLPHTSHLDCPVAVLDGPASVVLDDEEEGGNSAWVVIPSLLCDFRTQVHRPLNVLSPTCIRHHHHYHQHTGHMYMVRTLSSLSQQSLEDTEGDRIVAEVVEYIN